MCIYMEEQNPGIHIIPQHIHVCTDIHVHVECDLHGQCSKASEPGGMCCNGRGNVIIEVATEIICVFTSSLHHVHVVSTT